MKPAKLILLILAVSGGLIAGFYFYSFKLQLAFFQGKIADSYLKTAELQSKLLQAQNAGSESEQNTPDLTLLFVGDIMLDRGVEYHLKKNGSDWKFPFLKSAEFMSSADFTFGNLEGPISSRGANQGSQYSFRFNPKVIEGLKLAGFDAFSLANNHIFDWGKFALEDTLKLLRENNIQPVGAGLNYKEANEPAIMTINDTRLALLAYTGFYPPNMRAQENKIGLSEFEPEKIKTKITEVKKNNQADLVIISLHWGEEYVRKPSASQVRMAREFIEAGADLIIGHHPHVVQPSEQYKNGFIFYSLGNFIFDQNFSKETMEGLVVKITVKNKKILQVEEIPVKINKSFQPEIGSPSTSLRE